MKSNEEIIDEVLSKKPVNYEIERNEISECLDIARKDSAIDFFKWYVIKMVGFLEYIKNIRPAVVSNEIEEKIKEFEGQSFDNIYQIYLSEKLNP